MGGCFGEDSGGPFESYSELTEYYNHKLDVAIRFKKTSPTTSHFDERWPLVFTHQDLNMGNIMILNDGEIYLLDWDWAGYYPEYFEAMGTARNYHEPWLWRKMYPFIVRT